jgi:tight adherence protein B
MLLSTSIFLFCLFVTYALFLLASRKSDDRQERLRRRVAEALQESGNTQDAVVHISREDTIGGGATINRLLSSLVFIKRFDEAIRQADMRITVSRLLGFSFGAGLMAALAAASMQFGWITVVASALIAAALPILYVARKRQKRLHKLNEQLPDTLELLARSLAVGHAFSESLRQVSNEMPDPIASEFLTTFEEQKLGLGIKLALDRLTERVPLLDLRLCVTAMHIQRETGGNLAEILEKVAQTIRERFKLMEDFRTLTTSSRISGWVLCAIPVGLVLALTAVDPGYMSVLLHDTRGHYVIAFGITWQIIGMFMIKKIMNIKV